jgi:hypothetical protein
MASSSAAAGGEIVLDDDELGDDAALKDALAASLAQAPPSSSSAAAAAAAASGAKRARSELEVGALASELDATAAKLNALACRARVTKGGDDLREALKRIDKWREWVDLKGRNSLDVWWRLDDELIDVWLREGKITCSTPGCDSVVAATKWTNAMVHLKTAAHTKAQEQQQQLLLQPRIGASMAAASAVSAAVVAAKAPNVAAALFLSAVRFTVPSNIGDMYERDQLRMATYLHKFKGSAALSDGGAVARAREAAATMMSDLMTSRIAGNNAAILIDEANSIFGGSGRSRPLAILLACAKIGKPFLLRVVFNVWEGWESDEVGPDGVKFSVAAAAVIREECGKIGFDIKTQATCLVGDNAAVMDAIAELLGIPRLRCLPHCFALVYAVMTKSFPRVTVATCGLSTFISSGGGTARTDALAKAGVDPRRLKPKATRWGQVLKSNSYLLTKHGEGMVFDVVRGLLKDVDAFKVGKAANAKAAKAAAAAAAAASAAAAADDAAGADEAADDIDLVDSDGEAEAEKQVVISAIPGDVRKKTTVLTLLKNLHTAYEVVVVKRNFETELQMRIVDYLSSDLQHVLELCSADTNALAGDLVQRINDLRYRLSEAAEDHMQTVVLSRVFSSCSFEATEAEKAVYMKKYVPLIQHAAQSALVQWDKYIPEALTALRHRFLFDPKVAPLPMPAPKGLGYVEADVADFFGAIPGTIDLEVIGHWRLFVGAWDKLPTKLKELGIGPFWNHPDVLRIFPGGSIEGADLSKVAKQLRAFAMWHADKPTSNVATERAFGIMRAMEGKQRARYSDGGVNLELQAKVNSWMVDEIVKPIANSLPDVK